MKWIRYKSKSMAYAPDSNKVEFCIHESYVYVPISEIIFISEDNSIEDTNITDKMYYVSFKNKKSDYLTLSELSTVKTYDEWMNILNYKQDKLAT